jgi:hypothetical protein
MMRRPASLLCSSALLLGIALARSVSGDDAPVVATADARTNFFAGREAVFDTLVRGNAVDGSLVWVLTVGDRALADGAVAVRHAGRGATTATVAVGLPAGREGVVVDAALNTILADAAGRRLGSAVRRVRVFPADPFAGRRRWLESRRIVLVDPEGKTEKVLAAAGVPLLLARADADVAALRPQVLVVGEGLSWADHPGLSRSLVRLAAQGVNVLCLAPAGGTLPLPGTDDAPGDHVATSLALRRADVVADLDDRLDWRDWSAAGTVVGRLSITADRGAVVVQAAAAPPGWPWMEVACAGRDDEPPAGRLVVCGLGVVAHWEETPAARYLFAALLTRLAPPAREDADSPDPRPIQENQR